MVNTKKGQSQKLCHCGKRSVPGLKPGFALCQYHWNVYAYGKEWADQREVDRITRQVMIAAVDATKKES